MGDVRVGNAYRVGRIVSRAGAGEVSRNEEPVGASDWIQDQEVLLREGLHLTWKRMPCAKTYSYALARLDRQQVNAAVAAWCVRKEARSAGVGRNRAV